MKGVIICILWTKRWLIEMVKNVRFDLLQSQLYILKGFLILTVLALWTEELLWRLPYAL